jgi:hypothetical protein
MFRAKHNRNLASCHGQLVLITKANWSLNMKRHELIKSDLEAPFTRLCKPDIATTTKLFGDDLPKQLKDMTEVNLSNLGSCTSLGGINIRILGFVIQVRICTF